MQSFSTIRFEHVHQTHNWHADASTTVTLKINVLGEALDVQIIKELTIVQGWHSPVI